MVPTINEYKLQEPEKKAQIERGEIDVTSANPLLYNENGKGQVKD